MGILTSLRNVFGRSRKEQAAQAEGVTQETAPPATAPEPKLPSQPTAPPEPTEAPERTEATQVPEPRSETTADEHELVKAAFTNPTVPKQTETPDTTPEPKPEAKPKPEPKPAQEAKPEPEPKPEPEAQPKPAQEAKPEPEPEPEPKAAEKAEAEAEVPAEPTSTPEPAAADGEAPPQGPPAPDDEGSTGGAGGSPDAEGETEAQPTPAPQAQPQPTPAPQAQPQPTPAPEAKPATPAARLRSHAPGLATAYKAAGTALKKHDLTGTRARVHLVLDRSASMRPYYKDGSAQALAEQTLALAAHLDPEATVHVTFFSTEVDGTGELTLTDHENKIDELHAALGRMGRTSYHAAVEAVLAHHTKEEAPGTPALVVFQTDGAPDAKTPATQSLTKAAADHPNVHFSFVAFGDPENKAFDYLRKLKTGNASHFLAGETPKELTDKELYEGVLATWRP
ncbi:VWA domain-containing protein [Streptomyces sp. b94]|uniref:VWA domain-containing protein n=1 Tax=Streptomyces sp. b94 TaxID=1827634 RepID=UPI001B378385|nr:VWA domain-containing protein [Streptomyces sp. b94]MBQ1096206.1 VWA domain-containing protein [Streptomyces sp. b94]